MVFLVQSSCHLSRWDRSVCITQSRISHAWAPLSKNSKKNLDFYSFVTSFWLLIFEKWCKSTFKKYYAAKLLKNFCFLLASWRSMMKIEGSWSASGSWSGSICERHGSADPDPDPFQNVMDPEHWMDQGGVLRVWQEPTWILACLQEQCARIGL